LQEPRGVTTQKMAFFKIKTVFFWVMMLYAISSEEPYASIFIPKILLKCAKRTLILNVFITQTTITILFWITEHFLATEALLQIIQQWRNICGILNDPITKVWTQSKRQPVKDRISDHFRQQLQ
jgi:hypothetical protein